MKFIFEDSFTINKMYYDGLHDYLFVQSLNNIHQEFEVINNIIDENEERVTSTLLS